MFDRRLIENFNWGLLGLVFFMGCFGLVVLYSSDTPAENSSGRILFFKQLIWFGAGAMLMIGSFLFNYKHLDRWAHVIYALCIILLICVPLFGRYVGGARRWIALGPVSIQPSEITKIAVIIILSRYYSRVISSGGLTFRNLIPPMIYTLVPFILIIKQPDLGTAMLILIIAGFLTVFVKIERRTFISILSFGAICAPLVWYFLKGYQKQRILSFLNPDRDPLGTGYHIIQSKIAIGSGMMFGKGFMKGTQNALSFLPEQHTDFIFSVLAEEWGFIGAAAMVFLCFMIVVRGLHIAYGCRDPFGTILAVGLTAMLFSQIVINIAMVMGLMPVVGVPLPLISYGGSSAASVMVAIGILMNISMRRFMVE